MLSRWQRLAALILALALAVSVSTACMADPPPVDEGTPAPAAFVSPVDGEEYCAWVNNPHECDDSGYPPAPFAMPDNDLDMTTQGVSDDDDMLEALLAYHIMYHAFFNNSWYYNSYISPAWSRHPGTYYAWRGHPVVRVKNVSTYTTNARHFNNRYSDRIKASESKAQYTTKTGKVYNGKNVPKNKFSGTNAKPTRAGTAPKVGGVTGSKATPGSGKPGAGPKPGTGAKPKPPAAKPKPPAPKAPAPRAPAAPRPRR